MASVSSRWWLGVLLALLLNGFGCCITNSTNANQFAGDLGRSYLSPRNKFNQQDHMDDISVERRNELTGGLVGFGPDFCEFGVMLPITNGGRDRELSQVATVIKPILDEGNAQRNQ